MAGRGEVMTVTYHLSIPNVGCKVEETFELPDDWTEEEIQKDYETWMWEQIETSWW